MQDRGLGATDAGDPRRDPSADHKSEEGSEDCVRDRHASNAAEVGDATLVTGLPRPDRGADHAKENDRDHRGEGPDDHWSPKHRPRRPRFADGGTFPHHVRTPISKIHVVWPWGCSRHAKQRERRTDRRSGQRRLRKLGTSRSSAAYFLCSSGLGATGAGATGAAIAADRCSTEGACRLYIGPSSLRTARACSNAVAITEIFTSPPIRSSMTAPKMMLASGSAAAWMISAASFTSKRVRSGPPVMVNRTPRAPSIDCSRSGDMIAWRAASAARDSPEPWPMPMSADPAFVMIVF